MKIFLRLKFFYYEKNKFQNKLILKSIKTKIN